MGYDISNWKTVKLDKFSFPIAELYKDVDATKMIDGLKCTVDLLSGDVNIRYCSVCIRGRVEHGSFYVEDVSCEGIGSGHDLEEFLKPLFIGSAGTLTVDCVWERGDDTSQERWVNGEYSCASFGTAVEDELFLFVCASTSQGRALGASCAAIARTQGEASILMDEALKVELGQKYDLTAGAVDPAELKKFPVTQKMGIVVWDGDY